MGEEENRKAAQQQKSAPKQQPPAQSNFGMGGQIPTYNQYGRAPQNQYGNYPGMQQGYPQMQQGYPQMPQQQQYQGSWGRQQGPPIPFHPGGQQPQPGYGANPYMNPHYPPWYDPKNPNKGPW